MKLENIKVVARLKESPAAFFKVNKLTLSEDEKSINISSLNDMNHNNSKQGNFDNCFGKFSQYSEIVKGTECSKYLKQLLHGYNSAILSFGVGESDFPGSKTEFLIENLDNLKKLMEQNSYRYKYSLSFTIFGVSDGHCVNLLNYKKCNSLEISAFLQDFDMMKSIKDLEEVKSFILKGYSLPILIFIQLRTESNNEIEKTAANISNLCLGDLGSLSNPIIEKSISNLKSLILTLDQTFISGELRIRESPLTHLLSPFFGGNSHTLIFMEILTNSSFSAVYDSFLFVESLRKVKNRIEQVFENYLVEENEELIEKNEKLKKEKSITEIELKKLNFSLSKLLNDQEILKFERNLLKIDNESQKYLFDYNLSRMEIEKFEVKEKIRQLKIEMIILDNQSSLKGSQAFNESIERRRVELQLKKAMIVVRETENSFGGQIGNLRERILIATDELQRSVEERNLMKSNLKIAQQKIDQLISQLREVEISRSELERQSNDSKLEIIKNDLESEIRSMRRQLEQAKESERLLNATVNKVEGRSDQSRREIMELERELRILRTENNLLQSKLATKENISASTTIRARPKTLTETPIIPNIPVINVPSNQKQIPLEILLDSPIERRNAKRLSTGGNKTSSPTKKVKPATVKVTTTTAAITNTINDTPRAVMCTPVAATPSISNENLNGVNKVGLSSLLEGVGKKKIKLPERSAKITITSSQNSQSEIPRSTIIGQNGSETTVMDSIISSFNIPTIKK